MIDLGDELRAELGRNRTSDTVTLKVLDDSPTPWCSSPRPRLLRRQSSF